MARISLGWTLVFLVAGCNGTSRVEAPLFDPSAAVEKAFEDYDTNRDGFLDAKELDKCPALKSAMDRFDTNNDKRISREELQNRFNLYEDSQIGLIALLLRITLNDKPMSAATVELDPEKFMGSGISPARG